MNKKGGGGGARAGAGRKKKALADKISEGKTDKVTVNLKGIEMPAPKEYLKAPQKNGQENYAGYYFYTKTQISA